MFLTPTRIKGEVSSKGGRIQGETKPDSYTGRSSDPCLIQGEDDPVLIQGETKPDPYTGRTINPCRIQGETNDPTPMQKVFQIEHK